TPIPVDVVAGNQPAQNAGGNPGGSAQQPSAGEPNAPRNLRLTLTVPKREVYLHERIPVDITLYIGSIRVSDVQYPTFSGEGISLEKFAEPTQRQQVIGGETYQVVHFQTSAVPLRAGALNLGPATLRLNVLHRRRDALFNDPFFERFF